MIAYYGPVGDGEAWRATTGDVVRECKNAADAYRAALSLAGHRKDRIQKTNYPADKPDDGSGDGGVDFDDTDETPSGADDKEDAAEAVSGTVAQLTDDLDSGLYDSILDEIEAAEKANKNRSSALAAIDDRRRDIA
jgi:LPS O-antigen subunit length determinant protein (WzzB/FepE family)